MTPKPALGRKKSSKRTSGRETTKSKPALRKTPGGRPRGPKPFVPAEQEFRLLFETMLHGAVYQDAKGKIISMNPAAVRILGKTPSEFLDKTSVDVDSDTVREDGSPFPGLEHPSMVALRTRREVRGIRMGVWNPREKRRRWISVSAVPMFRPGETAPYQVYTIFEDVTGRKEMEEDLKKGFAELGDEVRERSAALAAAGELLEKVFSSIDLSIAYMDRNFNFIRVNRAYALAEGRAPEYYVGKNHFALFPQAENEAIFRRVVETGRPFFAYEKPFVYAANPERGVTYWDWSLQPVREQDGRVGGLILSLVNVTARKTAEQERLRLTVAVEQASDAIAITDANDAVLYVNAAFEKLHGLPAWEVLGRKYLDIIEADREGEAFVRTLGDKLDRGESWKGRLTRRMADGRERKIDVTISAVYDSSDRITNYSISERDSTEEFRLHETILQMQKMEALGTLAGGIAHDFNNILVPILVNTELALLEAPSDSPLTHHLNLVLRAANRGRDLVRQITTFSRQKQQTREPVDIAQVMAESLKFLRSSIPKTVEIRQSRGVTRAFVRADATQIQQVLMNLGSNAAYAMRAKGGVLEVGLAEVEAGPDLCARHPGARPGPCFLLTVSDTGEGMPADILTKAFDPFFTTKKPGEGTGMGLAVVHSIVRSHGAGLSAVSEVGRGTTFSILLPKAPYAPRPDEPEKKPAGGKERVLFVDDEEILMGSMGPMLERLGYRVTTRSDALEALDLFLRHPDGFDLVITDQTMPRMTGIDLAREILRVRPGLPVILCTGFSENVTGEDAASALGVRAVLMKPFTIQEMAEAIRRALPRADKR